MTLFTAATLFPHVKLTSQTLTVLAGCCGKLNMLSVNDAAPALPGNIKVFAPPKDVINEINAAYARLVKLRELSAKENVSLKHYTTAATPLYDKEAPLGLLSEFRAAFTADAGLSPAVSAALTLLLCEDLMRIIGEAAESILGAEGQSAVMWEQLKGHEDYGNMRPDNMLQNLQHDLLNENVVKKRLTAWSILAKMHPIESELYITLDKATFDYCLQIFKPREPLREISANNVKAVFYKLAVSPGDFLNALRGATDISAAACAAPVSMGYVEIIPAG